MKIIADENIAFAQEAFSQFGNVELAHGRKINNSCLKQADALIVRSITDVNKNLLRGTAVKFVGTATIGTDHIDLDYLHEQDITFTDAKGCNADAVAEYVFTALTRVAVKNNIDINGKTIGIVGVGNIGSRIERLALAAGMKVLKNDPPLQRITGSTEFVPLTNILDADIITIHVPLNPSGIDKTVHLFNEEILRQLKPGTILINAARGQVVDNIALLNVASENGLHIILDVWENEPEINAALLEKAEIGTPHIAGYSLEGKINGTKIIYDALCRFLGEKSFWIPDLPAVENNIIEVDIAGNKSEVLKKIFSHVYKIERDDKELKKMLWMQEAERGAYFDVLRKNYPLRREFSNYIIRMNQEDEQLSRILKAFRFDR